MLGEVPPAGTVFTGHGDAVPAPGVVPVAACPLVLAPAAPVVRLAELADDPAELPGFAAVPAPVPSVVAGTQVTGDMPAGLALPIFEPAFAPAAPVVAPGAAVVPPGV